MKDGRLDYEELRELCIRNQWFTHGTNDQYKMLFEMNDEGASLEQIATCIYLNSDNYRADVNMNNIKATLIKAGFRDGRLQDKIDAYINEKKLQEGRE